MVTEWEENMILGMQFSSHTTRAKQKQFDETLFNKKIVHGTQTTAKAETMLVLLLTAQPH